ncbi:UNC93-like protein 3 [Tanacetum coccineum]
MSGYSGLWMGGHMNHSIFWKNLAPISVKGEGMSIPKEPTRKDEATYGGYLRLCKALPATLLDQIQLDESSYDNMSRTTSINSASIAINVKHYEQQTMSAIAHVFLVPQNRSVKTPHVNGVVNAQKSLDDCKYITGLLEEWWEQPASTVAAWKCVLLSCMTGSHDPYTWLKHGWSCAYSAFKLSIVSQEPVLFNSSIEDNIASVFDGKASTFDIKKVAMFLSFLSLQEAESFHLSGAVSLSTLFNLLLANEDLYNGFNKVMTELFLFGVYNLPKCSLTAGRFTSGLSSITLICSGGAFLQGGILICLLNYSEPTGVLGDCLYCFRWIAVSTPILACI